MGNIFSQPGLGQMLQGQQEFYSRRQKEKLNRDLLRAQAQAHRAKAQQALDPAYQQRQLPAAIQTGQYYEGLSPERRKVFLESRRATPEEALYRKGVTIDPATGRASPIGGFGQALGDIGAAELQATQDVRAGTEPDIRGDITRRVAEEKTAESRRAGKSKAKNALLGFERDTKRNTKSIDKALDLISPWSAGYGSALSFLPESDAGKLKNLLTEIRARVGFDNLQEMRDNSPTGGALGQVSTMENQLLQAVEGTLDPAQSDQLRENLQIIKDLYPQVMKERRDAFRTDYGNGRRAIESRAAPAQDGAPQQGVVEDGYLFVGGDPADQNNWKKVK